MRKTGIANNIALTGFDDIFNVGTPQNGETVTEIALTELHAPDCHPFQVNNDDAMTALVESVKQYGVREPGLARPHPDGGYELLCGNRRKRACELAGLPTLPVIIRELSDDDAAIAMVDSNLQQREKLLFSEKAWAYRVKMEALNHKGVKSENHSVETITALTGDSRNTIFRLIRLTELVEVLLDKVDSREIAFNPAVELSYLGYDEQFAVVNAMGNYQVKPSLSQAVRFKKLKQDGKLTPELIDEVLAEKKESPASGAKITLGYALTGLTEYECFYILFGATTRNGKSTLIDAVTNVLGDYACTIQPQTFSRRSPDGASASPDMARLKGARLVNMPEPEKGLELNVALIKQMTGGDRITVRAMYEAPTEMYSEFKPFINTNHLPRTSDDTIFTSGRVKIIPFEQHFTEAEQDTGPKKAFRSRKVKSAILNWLVAGYRLLLEVDFDAPECVTTAIAEYRKEADVIGAFLADCTAERDGARVPTSEMYSRYTHWAGDNGYKPLNNRNFVTDLRKRFTVKHDGRYGNVLHGVAIS